MKSAPPPVSGQEISAAPGAPAAGSLSGPASGPPPGPTGRQGRARRVWRVLWRTLAALALLLVLVLAGALAALRNEGVQGWLVERVNAALAASPESGGLAVRLTGLSGPVPFGLTVGLEAADARGLWLRAPENVLSWDWRALPGTLRVVAVRSGNVELLRLPDLPPAPPSEPSPPLTEDALRILLADAARAAARLPGWLPQVKLERLSVENARLPLQLLGAPSAEAAPQAPSGSVAPAVPPVSSASPAPAVSAIPAASGMFRADVEGRLAAGASGAEISLGLRLCGVDGGFLPLAHMACEEVSLSWEAEARPARDAKQTEARVRLDARSALRASVQAREQAVRPSDKVPETPERTPEATPEKVPEEAPAKASAEAAGARAVPSGGPLAALLGSGLRLGLDFEAGVAAPAAAGAPADEARLALTALDVSAARLAAKARALWQGGASPWLDGALEAAFDLTLAPAPADAPHDPLAALAAPATVHLAVGGPLGAPDVRLAAGCAQIRAGERRLAEASVNLAAAPLAWGRVLALLDGSAPASPAKSGADVGVGAGVGEALAEEALLAHLDARGLLDARPLRLGLVFFAGRGRDGNFVAGLRDLTLSALGVEGSGSLAARLPRGGMPACDGRVDLRVADWRALSDLVPGVQLDGEAAVWLVLRHADAAGGGQTATVGWRVPRLSCAAAGAAPVQVRGLEGEAGLTDVFGKAALAARLDLAAVSQADMGLGARLRAQGPLAGPLDASLETTGAAAAHAAVRWQPGSVEIRRLEARLPEPALGFRAAPGAVLRYGEGSFAASGVDMVLTPSGRLRAQGGMSPEKLDFRLDLERLALTPWKRLVPSIPDGDVEARVRLSGSPERPGGDFRLSVRGLQLPGSQAQPLNAALVGQVERGGGSGGALAVRLDLDPASVKALGGSEARLHARVPLVFSKDGLPQPAMQGPLSGQVRWKGAVGPLWRLVPVADQRLSGQVDLSVELGGSPAAPAVRGFLRVDGARYENVALGVLLQDIRMRLDLESAAAAERARGGKSAAGGLPGAARLELSAADGLGGTVRLSGRSALNGGSLDLRAALDRLRPLRRRDVRIELSGQADVTGSAAAPEVRGRITVNQGEVLLNNLAVGGSVTTLPIAEAPAPPASAPAAPPQGGGLLDLRIHMPSRFVVEGHGLSSVWQADMSVEGAPAEPRISGQLNAARGSLELLGKTFTLARGTVTFAGGSVSNPLLDIMLTNQGPHITANVTVSGTVRKMQLSLSSNPQMPRDDILAYLLFGKGSNDLGRLENLRLAAAVAQLAGFGSGGGMFDTTKQMLGVDVLRLNSAPAGAPGSGDSDSGAGASEDLAAGASVEMGKYLTDELYVGVQQGMKQGGTGFVIQLEITPRSSLELHTEQQSTWGGFRWKHDY